MIASGKVFHDGLGELRAAQDALRWYPSDVWLYLLSCQWGRIDQEEAFMARCGDVGDELGSRLVASRMVEELMKLCFLMERQYWTFSKWFGTAFSRLECAATLTPVFDAVLSSTGWKEREKHLSEAYVDVGIMHNTLGITTFIEPNVSQFYDRPYQVPHAERYCFALRDCIQSDTVLSWPKYVGGVGQFVHSTDVLCSTVHCKRIGAIYE